MSGSNCAIIVENRLSNDALGAIVDDHLSYLEGWACVSFQYESIQSGADYNNLLTSESFWMQFQDFERVLIFQHDTKILREGIDEFMEWDYVGAPWKADAPWARKDRAGGNGGLSLRCPKKALNLVREFPYHPRHGNEDVWMTHHLDKVGGQVAPYEVCKRFSVETEFQLGTWGAHAIDQHLSPEQIHEIKTQYGDRTI